MKISAQKKKEILIESFELLKENYGDNSQALGKLIGKMSKIDFDLAVEMYKTLIKENPDVLQSENYYNDFSFSILYDFHEAGNGEKMLDIIVNDKFLKEALFHRCKEVAHYPLDAIYKLILQNELALVNELLELIFTNKYKQETMYQILDAVIPENKQISEDAFELLEEWIKLVKNKEERAKLNLKMLSFLDEEDE